MTADGPTGGALTMAVEQLRLEGAVFFRSEFTEAWAYESPPAEVMAATLRPGADRLIMFHIVACGSCWVSADQGERHWAREGDVVVLPYGQQHRMGGIGEAECVPIMDLFEPPPWTTLPVVRHGAGGRRTDIVCGYLHSEDPLFDPGMQALPPVFVVRPPDGPSLRWMQSSVEYALAASTSAPDAWVATRLPELLLMEVLRLHLSSAPAAEHGWVRALHDPVLAPALASMHTAPERKWTVAELAVEASASRSVVDQRFRDVLGRSPIRYLTEWRMHLAKDLLASTRQGVAQIARRVGYESEEAFSRAFKRRHGCPPTEWRAQQSTGIDV